MAFDAKSFLADGGNANLGTSLGVPSCMLNLAADVLNLIPSPILLALRHSLAMGRAIADGIIRRINSYIRDLLGISLFPNRDGFFGYFSDFSRMGLDLISGITGVIGTFIGFAQAAAAAFNELRDRYNAAKDCLDKYKQYLDYTNGNASERREELAASNPAAYNDMIDSQLGVYLRQAEQAQAFIDAVNNQIRIIDDILLQRTLNPELEPNADLTTIESVFRLDNGPPRSKSGKFVLSIDGLYYDSQTSGIEPALLELSERDSGLRGGEDDKNANLWRLEFDPSLGGRGVPTSSKSLKSYFNSVLDPNIIDDSKSLTKFYTKDELLLNLEGQKDRRVYDVSSELQDLIDAEAGVAIIDNARQVLLSQTSQFQDKINKRKKQIEIAVKIPTFLKEAPVFKPGEIPINDFSYLAGTNFLVGIEAQRSIILDQADVTGVVLPLDVKFTEKIDTPDPLILEHIYLSNIAKGEVVDNASSVSSAPSLQINTRIVEENLEVLYNYLTADNSQPFESNFDLRNSSRYQDSHNGQLVGETSSVFDKGLGIAKLEGICKINSSNNSILSSVGSYIRLPEVSQLQDLFYNPKGSSFETWIHMPSLSSDDGYYVDDTSTSALYRLILANENTGYNPIKNSQSDTENVKKDDGATVVRGIVYGFTRDRRFTQNLPASNNLNDNPLSDLSLVLAPTQSYNDSGVAFIANRGIDCERDSWRGMVIPVNDIVNNKAISSCGEEFCQLSLTMNPAKDYVKVYLDGSLISASSYQEVFGTTRRGDVFKAPSVYQANSFEYASSIVSSESVEALTKGPKLDTYFTPWIIGGGYTDGNPEGNFMGGIYGGKVSGLRGYIGCTRFYSKPLQDEEVLNNFNATQKFFKNIDLD